jgi:hypothetical protein
MCIIIILWIIEKMCEDDEYYVEETDVDKNTEFKHVENDI